ncbi:hypothetical protein [Thioclava sp. F42-5]|uniref:hypothetical protein n=1 Tax=Thioclava sp. F42-5 TaxID=1973005 RepID=UPI001F0AEDC2|nr:hypothetical protein [Thioclava sp. F42-5]
MGTDAAQVDEPIDGSKQVILRNTILQRELEEQHWLSLLLRSHHRQSSHLMSKLNQRHAQQSSASLSTEYALFRHTLNADFVSWSKFEAVCVSSLIWIETLTSERRALISVTPR